MKQQFQPKDNADTNSASPYSSSLTPKHTAYKVPTEHGLAPEMPDKQIAYAVLVKSKSRCYIPSLYEDELYAVQSTAWSMWLIGTARAKGAKVG